MYIRFVVSQLDGNSGKRMGLFHALGELRDAGKLYPHEQEQEKALKKWFGNHLKKPSSFSRSSKTHAHRKAISWFKDSAKEHISKMREMVAILEAHGVHVEVIQTERPGYIVYEDEFQITAEGFKETET